MIEHLVFKFETLKRDFNTALANGDNDTAMNFFIQELEIVAQINHILREQTIKEAKARCLKLIGISLIVLGIAIGVLSYAR